MILPHSQPRLAAKARLRFDRRTSRYLLLYPERGLELNPTAAETVQLCTGEHSVEAIIERLAQQYSRPSEEIESEVLAFLSTLADRALIDVGP